MVRLSGAPIAVMAPSVHGLIEVNEKYGLPPDWT
jgi:hypothetical protein